jgi:predicted DNA-binding antitoxin AbrB/MazE fold protein
MDQEAFREAPSGGRSMSQIITATFEDGIFKPDIPPALDPKARVRLIVEPLEVPREAADAEESMEEVRWDDFEKAMDDITNSSGFRMTRDELHDRD